MDQTLLPRTSYPKADHEHVTGLTNAQRYSVIIKSFLSGVGSDVLRAILMQAADRADCTIQEFLYVHQTSIIYNLQKRSRDQVILVYPPDNSVPVIQQWNCRLLCLILKASGCLDTRGEDDINFIERTYHKHTQSEKTRPRHSASGTKQQPKPRREWIRTCGAIQRLVENLDDARLLSSVRNFICKIEMGAKTMDARIQSHLSLTKMISELAASHSDRLNTEEKVLRKQIGELAKIKQQYDTVSKPSFVSSRSSKNMSRSMIVDGKETRPLSATDRQLQDKPLRPKSAGSVISQKTTETSITKPFTRTGSFDSAKIKDIPKTQKRPFSHTRQPIETLHLVTPKLSHARKEISTNVDGKNMVDGGKTDGLTEAGPPSTNGRKTLVSSYKSKSNGSMNVNSSTEVKRKVDKTTAKDARETVSMSDFSKLSKTLKNKEYANSVNRPHSFDVSGTNRLSARLNANGSCHKKNGSGLQDEKETSVIKDRYTDIEKVYSQSLKLLPQPNDKQTHSEKRISSHAKNHMQDSLIEKQNQARLVVSQPTYSSLVAYTSKLKHKSIGKNESNPIKPKNSNDTPGKIVDEKIIEDSVNNEHIEGKEDTDKLEKVSQNSSVQSESKKEPSITPAKTKNAFGLFKDMLKNAFSSKKSENIRETHKSNNESRSTEVISNHTETVYHETASSPGLEAAAPNSKMHAQNEKKDSTLFKMPSSSKDYISITRSTENIEKTIRLNQNKRNGTSSNMVQDIGTNKSKTSDESPELHINKKNKEQSSDNSHAEAKQNTSKTPEGRDIKQLKEKLQTILPTTKAESVMPEKECEILQKKENPFKELLESVSNAPVILPDTENKQVNDTKEATRAEQTNGTKLRKTTRVHFGTEQDNSTDTLNTNSNFREAKQRRQSLPAIAFLSQDKPTTDKALNNLGNVDRKSPSVETSSPKSPSALKTQRRASLAATSLHGPTGVKLPKELNKPSKSDLKEKETESKSKVVDKQKNENMVIIEVEKDDGLKEDSNNTTVKTQSTEDDTNFGSDKRVESTKRSTVIVPTSVQKQETRKAVNRPERRKSIAVGILTQQKSKQELFQRPNSRAEFNSEAIPINKQTNEKQTSKTEHAIVLDSNMRPPPGENDKANKKSLLENTALYEDEVESDIDCKPNSNSAKQNTLGEKRRTAETDLDHSNVQDELEEKTKETHVTGANIDSKQSDRSQDTNNLNHQLSEEDPEAEMKRIANDVIVHHQVHKVAREFMEKDKQFVDEFFTFLHKYKATKEFLKSEQYSPLKTMRLPTGIKAALSFLHAFTYRHVNVFERDQCNYVVEKIVKRMHCEDAQRVKEKEEEMILKIKSEMKSKKHASVQDGKTDKMESASNMRKKKNNLSNEDNSQNSKNSSREERLESQRNKRPMSSLKKLHDIEKCKCWKCQQKDLAMTVAVNWRNHGICHLLQSYGVNFKIDHLLPAVRANDADNVKEIVAYLKKRFEWDPENGDAKMALILARFHDMQDIVVILEREGVQDERVVQCTCFA